MTFKELLDDAAGALQRLNAVAKTVGGSPITQEAERLVPSLEPIVGGILAKTAVASAVASFVPELEAAIVAVEILQGHANEDLDHFGPGRQEVIDHG